MVTQKEIFLGGEGDAWLRRNRHGLVYRGPDNDPVFPFVEKAFGVSAAAPRILEIGCANGVRLEGLKKTFGAQALGLEPSAEAVAEARAKGLEVVQGTADSLPFGSASVDMVIFGFCLYLCDPEDLFRIAAETDRVLRSPGWVLIHDFFAQRPVEREYTHRAGVVSRKMDFRTLFTWHPSYVCYLQHVEDHGSHQLTDDSGEWTALSLIRKLG